VAVSDRQKRAVKRGIWGVKGGWVHWGWHDQRPPRYAPYQAHWGTDVVPGSVTPHEPHGPAFYQPDEVQENILAPMNGTIVRNRNDGSVGGFFNDLLIEYRVRSLQYPVDKVYVLYGHLLPGNPWPSNAQVGAGDLIAKLGTKQLSLREIIHTHVQVWHDLDDALTYNHPTTKDPMLLWRAINLHVEGG